MLFVIVASLDKLGVNTSSMVAIFGAAGLAIGLSLQGSLQNFAAGVMLVTNFGLQHTLTVEHVSRRIQFGLITSMSFCVSENCAKVTFSYVCRVLDSDLQNDLNLVSNSSHFP